jgi:hypothetical protein
LAILTETNSSIREIFLAMMQASTNPNVYKSQYGLSTADLLSLGDINHDGQVSNSVPQALLNLLKSGGGSFEQVMRLDLPRFSASARCVGR